MPAFDLIINNYIVHIVGIILTGDMDQQYEILLNRPTMKDGRFESDITIPFKSLIVSSTPGKIKQFIQST